LLAPLLEVLRRHLLSATKLHADDTPVPVLAPGRPKNPLKAAVEESQESPSRGLVLSGEYAPS